MDKNECLKLMEQHFYTESFLPKIKNPDFNLKSRIFYFRDVFKDIGELRILRISSKNTQENIVFDVYYVSKYFEGLFSGYFMIKPDSPAAKKVFEGVGRVCVDLGEYLYYLYKNSKLLKVFLVTGSIQSMLGGSDNKDYDEELKSIYDDVYLEVSNYSADTLYRTLLRRDETVKYIDYFVKLNSKCSEAVRTFLITLMSKDYLDHICFINNYIEIENCVILNTERVFINKYPDMSVYSFLDYCTQENMIVFIKMEFDFKGVEKFGNKID